jgi:DNA-binding transcriptional ArsR family regulator
MCYDLILLKAISDGTRLSILHHLLDDEKCACEIIPLVKKKQSTVSIHLSFLESIGIITSRREGRKTIYSITDDRVREVLEIIKTDKKRISNAEILC